MDNISYLWIPFAIFIILRKILSTNRSPIPETSGKVIKVANAAEFDALLSSTTHVVVDISADSFPPSRAIAPVFSKLADKHASNGQLAFAKVNVDHVNNIAPKYLSVSARPTFLIFQNTARKGEAVEEGYIACSSIVLRVRGAHLQTAVQSLASQGANAGKD